MSTTTKPEGTLPSPAITAGTGEANLVRSNPSPQPPAAPVLPREIRERLVIVIAAYCEAGSIGNVVRELRTLYPRVVVVDDGSFDTTADEATRAGALVLRHYVNRGQGAALQTGIHYALALGADYLVTFDADGQHDMSDLPALVMPLVRGEVEICLGSRFLDKPASMPLRRRILIKLAVLFTRMTSRVRLTDAHNGYRAFTRKAATALDIQLDRMAHASEIVDQFHASGLPYREVAVRVHYTAYSLQKGQRNSAAFKVAFDYLMGRLTR